jgi:hypothetical protein
MPERDNSPRRTHGLSRSAIYNIWNAMRQRCENPSNDAYDRYGGRGIKVCDRWLKFENFLADMGTRPSGKSLDRVDNDGNYEPGNVEWRGRSQQARNKSNNRRFEFMGKNLCIAEWCEEIGMKDQTLKNRLYSYGWSIERALTTPVRKWPGMTIR